MSVLLLITLLLVGVECADKTVTVGDITTKVLGQSGKIAIYKGSNMTDGVTITFDALSEMEADGSAITGTQNKHSFNTFATHDFTFTDTTNATFPGTTANVTQFSFVSTIDIESVSATLTSYVYIFTADANITVDGETVMVKAGDVKFNVKIENWPFCGTTGVTCTKGQTDKTGAFLDFSIEIKGKSAAMKDDDSSKEYELGGGSTVIVPKQVVYDGNAAENMPEGYPMMSTQGSKETFTFRFAKFDSSVLYDPIVSLAAGDDDSTDPVDKTVTVGDITTKVLGQSGKITIYKASKKADGVTITFDAISEMEADGSAITGTQNKHSFNTFATHDFTFTDTTDATFPGTSASVKQFSFVSTIAIESVSATLTSFVYIFTADANITVDGETMMVKAGDVKFNVKIENWPFCGTTGVTCTKGQTDKTGAFLDFSIEIKGKSAAMKDDDSSKEYELGGGSTVIVPKQVIYDGGNTAVNMPDGYPMVSTQGSKETFTFRFVKFDTSVLYDPIVSLGTVDISGSTSRRISYGTIFLVALCSVLKFF